MQPRIVLTLLGVVLSLQPSTSLAQQPSATTLPLLPSAPTPTSSIPNASILNNGYRLGAGDRINLSIFNLPDYSQEYQLLPDGTVNLPLIGSIPLAGLSIPQATEILTNRYRQFIRRPVITVDLLSSRPLQLAIVGEVNRPGSYTVNTINSATGSGASTNSATGSGASIFGTPTLTQALQLAGGITESADIRQIEVRRRMVAGLDTETVVQINLWELLNSGNLNQDIRLRDGDTVFVPTAVALSPSEAAELSEASFSPARITVNVVGEVKQPGAIQVPPNTPLNQALLAAGGFTTRATTESVELIRLNRDGTVSRRALEVDLTQNVSDDRNPILRNNDAIVVQRSVLAETADTTSAVLQPVNGIVGLVRLILGLF